MATTHSAPLDETYHQRVAIIRSELSGRDRLTFGDIKALLNTSNWVTKRLLEQASKTGDLYKYGKRGYFLDAAHYEAYAENLDEKLRQKRIAASRAYNAAMRANRPKPKPVKYINIVCQECRQNWQGYQVHKIFGSGARA
ncbi:hypothetical protein EDF88_4157 [Buttiauxella sp. BIGb0552]|uniref:hypothetical protein n=1 Tax=Buttiauxella sp. BIGb0552 TaxID=2485120 RepID=UPI001064682B|nr:hypothetical protein [Buttiauxella sp. BIGb0552]TDX14831.1 hypothetical protein EDF88_4157 [Buttiauxella sp. BIGb0552]